MQISEVVETPEGTITFKTELDQKQVSAMVKWFITTMVRNGAVKYIEDNQIVEGPDTVQ
jgi:hypothetical protein